MVLEKLQIIIDADSRGALKELEKVGTTAQKELGKAETATQRTSAQLKSIGSATALGGLAIVGSLGALAKASDDADKQVTKLESSIQGSTNTFKNNGAELTDLAESLQQVTAADADAIIGTQSLLVQFGLTEDQVKTLTPLVVDLSRKMGVDLDTAAKAVSKAVDGSGGALKKMGINLDESKLAADGFGTTVESLRVAVGGLDYLRYGAVDFGKIQSIAVFADMPHSVVRLYATRGGRGKDGKQPLTQTRMCDMNDEWLQAVLDYGGAEWHLNIIRNEIEYRTKTRTSSN